MNNYRKFAAVLVIAELLLLLLGNICFQNALQSDGSRLYRVEISWVAAELADTDADEIDLSKYETITGVELFDAGASCRDDYVVEEVNGKLYRICYQAADSRTGLVIFNAFLLVMMGITVFLLWYLGRKILRPFQDMGDLAYELAKGKEKHGAFAVA